MSDNLPRLYPVKDLLDPAALVSEAGDDLPEAREIAQWVRAYLTRPHPELGRSGPVCPWVDESISRGLCLLTVLPPGGEGGMNVDEVVSALGAHYLAMEPRSGRTAQFKAIIMVFTGIAPEDVPDVINGLHQRLKLSFVSRGMMLGEFFPSCEKPGLRNEMFRPLRSPLPLLVIRPMVRQDIVFLFDKAEFIRAYLRAYGQSGRQEIHALLAKRSARIDRDSRIRLLDAVRARGEGGGAESTTGRAT